MAVTYFPCSSARHRLAAHARYCLTTIDLFHRNSELEQMGNFNEKAGNRRLRGDPLEAYKEVDRWTIESFANYSMINRKIIIYVQPQSTLFYHFYFLY